MQKQNIKFEDLVKTRRETIVSHTSSYRENSIVMIIDINEVTSVSFEVTEDSRSVFRTNSLKEAVYFYNAF